MSRIRTIKPEFFQHETLFDLEDETGLPVRLAFVGLWTEADREGRFQWRPRKLKLNVLPYDDVDMGEVMAALERGGFIRRYAVDGELYGYIPSWAKHQNVNPKESDSKLPEPPVVVAEDDANSTRDSRVTDACSTRGSLVPIFQLGKGKEGKGKERNGKGTEVELAPVETDAAPVVEIIEQPEREHDSEQAAGNAVISPKNAPLAVQPTGASRDAATKVEKRTTPVTELLVLRAQLHAEIHEVEPHAPRGNAQVNGLLSKLVAQVGQAEAGAILTWFYRKPNNYYRQRGHDLKLMMTDLAALSTEVKRQAPILKDQREASFKAQINSASVKDELLRMARARGENV